MAWCSLSPFPVSFSLGLTLPDEFVLNLSAWVSPPEIRLRHLPFDEQSPKPVRSLARNPNSCPGRVALCQGCPRHPRPSGVSGWLLGPSVRTSPDRLLTGLVEGMVPSAETQENTMQNIVILAGNIGQAPEARTTQGGTKITHFTLATSRPRHSVSISR